MGAARVGNQEEVERKERKEERGRRKRKEGMKGRKEGSQEVRKEGKKDERKKERKSGKKEGKKDDRRKGSLEGWKDGRREGGKERGGVVIVNLTYGRQPWQSLGKFPEGFLRYCCLNDDNDDVNLSLNTSETRTNYVLTSLTGRPSCEITVCQTDRTMRFSHF